jgi:hypothetical protein
MSSKLNARLARTFAGHGRNSPKKPKLGHWRLQPYVRYLPEGVKVRLKPVERTP